MKKMGKMKLKGKIKMSKKKWENMKKID